MIHDMSRLREVLGGPDARWLRERLRRHLERRGALPVRVTLQTPTDAQRELVHRLFGRVGRGDREAVSVSVARLEETLRSAHVCDDLSEALEALEGPLRDLRAEAARRAQAWERTYDLLAARIGDRAWLEAWLDELRSTGLLRRMSGDDPEAALRLGAGVLDVADRFPLDGVALPELAARVYGDAHALDRDRNLGSLAARAAARFAGLSDHQSADAFRECWAVTGVICDELSAPVLTLGLGAAGTCLTDRVLGLHHDAGEPCSLALRQLVRAPPDLAHLRDRPVFICENPTVVAVAAARLGRRSAPLVCTSGHLRAAARVLLRALAAVGARIRVQADMDIAGLHIATRALSAEGATPWRMTADAYRRAAAGPALRSDVIPDTPWDPALHRSMAERGVAVHEESLLDRLLEDLDAERPNASC